MSDTDAPEVAPDERDGWELLDTGRVRLYVSGKPITLREPGLGDVKKLKRAYFAAMEKMTATAPGAERADAEFDGWLAWLRQAVDTFGDAKLPSGKAADSLPAGWATMGFAATLINHWQAVPNPRGAAAPTA